MPRRRSGRERRYCARRAYNLIIPDKIYRMVGGGSRRVFEMMPTKKSSAVRQLRRYGGCRLYDPERQAYLGPQDLERLIRRGVRISVREVDTGQDVTHEVVPPDLQ
jgi:hypothetical protein